MGRVRDWREGVGMSIMAPQGDITSNTDALEGLAEENVQSAYSAQNTQPAVLSDEKFRSVGTRSEAQQPGVEPASEEIQKVLEVLHGGEGEGFQTVAKTERMAQLDESTSVDAFLNYSKEIEPKEPKPVQPDTATFSMDCCGARGSGAPKS